MIEINFSKEIRHIVHFYGNRSKRNKPHCEKLKERSGDFAVGFEFLKTLSLFIFVEPRQRSALLFPSNIHDIHKALKKSNPPLHHQAKPTSMTMEVDE